VSPIRELAELNAIDAGLDTGGRCSGYPDHRRWRKTRLCPGPALPDTPAERLADMKEAAERVDIEYIVVGLTEFEGMVL
jgi:hypothetical protein